MKGIYDIAQEKVAQLASTCIAPRRHNKRMVVSMLLWGGCPRDAQNNDGVRGALQSRTPRGADLPGEQISPGSRTLPSVDLSRAHG